MRLPSLDALPVLNDLQQEVLGKIVAFELANPTKSVPKAHLFLGDPRKKDEVTKAVEALRVGGLIDVSEAYDQCRSTCAGLVVADDHKSAVSERLDQLLAYFKGRLREVGVKFHRFTSTDLVEFGLKDTTEVPALTILLVDRFGLAGTPTRGNKYERFPWIWHTELKGIDEFQEMADWRSIYERRRRMLAVVENEKSEGETPMTQVPRSNERIALVLSGGGFRATLFHLGVIECLETAGMLKNVTAVIGVSGGAFAAVDLRLNWPTYTRHETKPVDEAGPQHASQKLVAAMKAGFRRNRPTWGDATDRFPRFLESIWGKGATLKTLGGAGPQCFVVATDVRKFHQVAFTSTGGTAYGEAEEEVASDGLPISTAVAASAAFPMLFRAVSLGPLKTNELTKSACMDGGVSDNSGLVQLLRVHSKLQSGEEFTRVVYVDAGKAPMEAHPDCADTILSAITRAVDCAFEKPSEYALHWAHSKLGSVPLTHVSILGANKSRGGIGYNVSEASKIAVTRTDLDSFSDEEQDVLRHHGWCAAANALGVGYPQKNPKLVFPGTSRRRKLSDALDAGFSVLRLKPVKRLTAAGLALTLGLAVWHVGGLRGLWPGPDWTAIYPCETPDGGPSDAGPLDGGPPDTGHPDAGPPEPRFVNLEAAAYLFVGQSCFPATGDQLNDCRNVSDFLQRRSCTSMEREDPDCFHVPNVLTQPTHEAFCDVGNAATPNGAFVMATATGQAIEYRTGGHGSPINEQDAAYLSKPTVFLSCP